MSWARPAGRPKAKRSKKTAIQVPIEYDLLASIDAAAGRVAESRAAFIRDACAVRLRALAEEAGDRQYEAAYGVRSAVTVAPVTTTIRDIPVEVVLDEGDGLPRRCVVNLDDVTTIPRDLLVTPLAVLSREKLQAVETAIRFALDLS